MVEHKSLDRKARKLLDDLFDKWSLLVLDILCAEPKRFSELKRLLPDITAKSLTNTLRRLENNLIIERSVLSTRPLTVSYQITENGRSLEQPLQQVLEWFVTQSGLPITRVPCDREGNG